MPSQAPFNDLAFDLYAFAQLVGQVDFEANQVIGRTFEVVRLVRTFSGDFDLVGC